MQRNLLGLVTAVCAGRSVLYIFPIPIRQNGALTDRVDRLSGATCIMPCLTPSPTREPTDLGAQRAIAAIQDRPDTTALLAALPADDPDKRYSWSAFPGRAVQHGPGSTDESTYLVCYCLPDTRGYRWEAHLKTHEVFYVNDNANLSAKYGALY
jgi:hypothetical protein